MRRLSWIFWLMIALLPLRGWAFAAMSGPQAEPAAHLSSAASPCHGEAVEATGPQGDHHDETGSDPHAASHGCPLCQICHSTFANAQGANAWLPSPQPSAVPPWHAVSGSQFEPDALFKPPRS
jgi:hypothetical protein